MRVSPFPSIALTASLLLLAVPQLATASPTDLDPDTPVSKILSLASSALAQGAGIEAIAYYDIAVSKDPSNYLTIFKRGATQLSLGRSAQALLDFDRVLTLKPDFEGALTQRAKIRSRQGNWKAAREDYFAAKKKDSDEFKALDEAEGAAQLARDAKRGRNWEACVTQASNAIVIAAGSLELRSLRSRCRLEKGEVMEALNDLQHVLVLNPSATEAAIQISAMTFYSLGEQDKGLAAVKKCLQSDPDNKACGRMFKRQKRVQKAINKVRQAMEKRRYTEAVQLLTTTGEERGLVDDIKEDLKELRQSGSIHQKAGGELLSQVLEMACSSFLEMNNHKRASPYCNDLLAHAPHALPALLHKAQSLMDADDFEGAVRTLKTAQENSPGANQSRKLQDMMQKAQTLLKRSKTKDYYKVLEVDREASEKEIKKAYRKMSKLHHPDKASNAEARQAAEKKMAAINEAYEVLSDSELRAQFDQGHDPNDPEANRGGPGGFPGGGQPFFFQQGGGGGGQKMFFQSGGRGGGGGGGGGMPNFGGFPGGFQFQFP